MYKFKNHEICKDCERYNKKVNKEKKVHKLHAPHFSWVQALWLVAGLTLYWAGCLVLNLPDGRLIEVANKLGIAMLISALINIFVFARKEKQIHGSRWLLADGMCTACLSVFPIFNKMIMPVMIPFFFGVWEIISGVLKVLDSKELKEERIRGFHSFFAIGCFELVSGVMSMVKTIDVLVGYNHIIAMILYVQSLGFLFKILIYNKLIEK